MIRLFLCGCLLSVLIVPVSLARECQGENLPPATTGYGRFLLCKRMQESETKLGEADKAIRDTLKATRTGEAEHDDWLISSYIGEQKLWLQYRNMRCNRVATVLVYPVDSRMHNDEYNSCVATMNQKRAVELEVLKTSLGTR